MKAHYHIQITETALRPHLSQRALQSVVRGNLMQDGLTGLLFHPEYHFDDNRFQAGEAYLAAQRRLAQSALLDGDLARAWQAFGRLSHAAQDFYAHSNYTQLYREAHPTSLPEEIDPLDPPILNSPRLRSGQVHWGWEILLHLLPGVAYRLRSRIPAGTHASMNLDHPGRGPRFAFAVEAAIKRTAHEFNALLESLDVPLRQRFCDRIG